MKKMQIFEPAMCCSTGLCGVGVDPELLRISTVLNVLEKKGVKVERFNLTDAPTEFIKNKIINQFLYAEGAEGLPVALVDGEMIIKGRYPSNEELIKYLELPKDLLSEVVLNTEETPEKSEGCGGCGGCS